MILQSPLTQTAQPVPFKVDDCLEKMMQFVKAHNLVPIYGKDLSDEELEYILRPQAEAASKLPMKLNYINRELLMQLIVMGLYDLVVLVGRSPLLDILTLKNKE